MKRILILLLVCLAPLTFGQATAKYPDTLASWQDVTVSKDLSRSTLREAIDAEALTIPVTDGTKFVQFEVVVVEGEQVQICSIVGNDLTACGRGANGTTASAHNSGLAVMGSPVAAQHNQLAAELIGVQTALGANLSNVVKNNTDVLFRRMTILDATPTTGSTTLTVQAGEGQGGNNLQEWKNNIGTILSYLDPSGNFTATKFTGSGAGLLSGTVPIDSLVAGDYSAKLSGTYGINITGNAATATTALNVPIASLVAGDFSSKITSGTYGINISGNAATATTATTITGGLTWANVTDKPTLLQHQTLVPAHFIMASDTVDAAWPGAAMQVRESLGTGVVETTRAPRIAFHWANVNATQIGMDSAGTIRTYDNPGTGYAPFAASSYNGLTFQADGVAPSPNQIIRSDGSGYVNFGWINTVSGDNGTSGINRVYASGDAYIRYYTMANFSAQVTPNWGNILGKPGYAANANGIGVRMYDLGCGNNYLDHCDDGADGWPQYANSSGYASSSGGAPWAGISSRPNLYAGSDNRVGIGDGDPQATLHVSKIVAPTDTMGGSILINRYRDGSWNGWRGGAIYSAASSVTGHDYLGFTASADTNPVDMAKTVMAVTSNGAVGIGTTAPGASRLELYASAPWQVEMLRLNNPNSLKGSIMTFTEGSGLRGSIGSDFSSTYSYWRLLLQSSGGLLSIGNSRVGVNVAVPNYEFQISTAGAAKPTNEHWTIVSDARTKTNIRRFTDGLDLIRLMQPKAYEYNGMAGTVAGATGIGPIAQDIQEIAPYMVSTVKTPLNPADEPTDVFTVNTAALEWVLVNAIQQLEGYTTSPVDPSEIEPPCDDESRGKQRFLMDDLVGDHIKVCGRNSAGEYSWKKTVQF